MSLNDFYKKTPVIYISVMHAALLPVCFSFMARQPLLIAPGIEITIRHTTFCKSPLDEGSARRRNLW